MDNEARLDVSDDGRGFEPDGLQDLRSDRDKSYGLQGVRERLELVGGTIDVDSRPGEGTSLHIAVPKDLHARSGQALLLAQEV
jgi:signal transduction histidine kinase